MNHELTCDQMEDVLTRCGTAVAFSVRGLQAHEREMVDEACALIVDELPEVSVGLDGVTFGADASDGRAVRPTERANVGRSRRITINAAFFASASRGERAAVILHELFHVLHCDMYNHVLRGRRQQISNWCSDAEINDTIRDLHDSGMTPSIYLPDDVIHADSLEETFPILTELRLPTGLGADDYYERIAVETMRYLEAERDAGRWTGSTVVADHVTDLSPEDDVWHHYHAATMARSAIQAKILEPGSRWLGSATLLERWASRPRFTADSVALAA